MTVNPRITIFYAWGTENIGDYALVVGALHLLKSIVPQHRITIVNRYHPGESPYDPSEDIKRRFPDVNIVSSPFVFSRKNRMTEVLRKTYGLILSLVCMSLPRFALRLFKKDALQHLASSELILLMGGNLFYWHRYRKSIPRLLAFAFPLVMAHRLGIPFGFLPQTSGPFEGKESSLIGGLFQHADFVLFRDSVSLQNVESIADLNETRVAVVPDLAFFISGDKKRMGKEVLRKYELDSDAFVAVTIRASPLGDAGFAQQLDDPSKTQAKITEYLPKVLAIVNRKLDKDIVIVVQAEGDYEVSQEISRELKDKYNVNALVINSRNLEELLEIYSGAALLIGMRLHSMIFALTQGTPVIGIWRRSLGPKIPAMMNDLGLGDFAFELNSSEPEDLLRSVRSVLSRRVEISEHITRDIRERLSYEREIVRTWIQEATAGVEGGSE